MPDENNQITILVGASVGEFTDQSMDPVQEVKELLSKKSKNSLESINTKHKAWWRDYWSKSYIQIESDDSLALMMENFWYLHKYLMASSYRSKYPSKFNHGIWTTHKDERQWEVAIGILINLLPI
jgi:trehalose/maltose hydrolase-like predicted phosphorylase